MCSVCGCGQAEAVLEKGRPGVDELHRHEPGEAHDHGDGTIPHAHEHDHACRAEGHVHALGVSAERMIRIEQDILSKNDVFARENRRAFSARRVFALNVVSSPGSGKTSLLVKAIEALKGRLPTAVIEGDQQTSNDADRIRASGAPAIQINTGKGCHLDAHMVGHAVEALAPENGSALFIENVGNLVCRPRSISARRAASSSCPSRRARTSRSSIRTCSPPPTSCCSTRPTFCPISISTSACVSPTR